MPGFFSPAKVELDRRQHGKYDKIKEKNEIDLNITDINPLICYCEFLPCCEQVHDKKEFSRENSKSRRESRITTR